MIAPLRCLTVEAGGNRVVLTPDYDITQTLLKIKFDSKNQSLVFLQMLLEYGLGGCLV